LRSSSQSAQPLDLETFPLDGLSLIEASAGTGKTFTLVNLYLRYLLEKKIDIESLLVVTFTKAATQELRDRIRAAIVGLIAQLDKAITAENTVLFIENMNEGIEKYLLLAEEDLHEMRLRLLIAERQIDLAEIHTIHGFAQKMLQEYALDIQIPTQQVLVEEVEPSVLRAVKDFWRVGLSSINDQALTYILSLWRSPESLYKVLKPILLRQADRLLPAPRLFQDAPPLEHMALWQTQFDQAVWQIQAYKKFVTLHIDDVKKRVAESNLKSVKNKLKWLDKIEQWALSESIDFPSTSSIANLLLRFSTQAVISETKKGCSPLSHPMFERLSQVSGGELNGLREGFLLAAHAQINATVLSDKVEQHAMGFDDLITLLEGAVSETDHRSKAQVAGFITTLRKRFYVAMVDEFQDTDRAQYQIFDRVFGAASAHFNLTPRLILIGDPKQAIYGFRGGDIQTYLKAKRDVLHHAQGYVFTMQQNWRASAAMVAAINAIFLAVDSPFRHALIPYVEVSAAQGENQKWPMAAMQLTQINGFDGGGKARTKAYIQAQLALVCSQQVLSLLSGSVCESPVASEDIAILVRDRVEALLMQQQLARVGIRASFEGRRSIFDSPEAIAVLALLKAVADPGDIKVIKTCLADLFFNYGDREFKQLMEYSATTQTLMTTFRALQQCWWQHGVLAMLREALVELSVLAHWQRAESEADIASWERSLSNFNQLAELLQHKSRELSVHSDLIVWLHASIFSDRSEADDTSHLRLESDEKLVRIVTIHKSKGLEYDVVFLPFMFSAKKSKEAWFYDQENNLCFDLHGQSEHAADIEQARSAEDIRLLYVALTRSKYRCYVGTAASNDTKGSIGIKGCAWGMMVLGTMSGDSVDQIDDAYYREVLCSLTEACAHIDLQHYSDAEIESLQRQSNEMMNLLAKPKSEMARLSPLPFTQTIKQSKKVQSFTGLLNEHHHLSAVQAHKALIDPRVSLPYYCDILDFPRGSEAGTMLHMLFEAVDFSTGELCGAYARRYVSLEDMLTKLLETRVPVPKKKLQAWVTYLSAWLKDICRQPLLPGFSLSNLETQDYLVEMSFQFSVADLDMAHLNKVLLKHSPEVAPLLFKSFAGYMTGAIDLLFRHNGKYYILDYKSNHLGFQAEDYAESSLHTAILHHRYDVQYLLYTLATHRFLAQRLGEHYDYDQHMGGAVYLFLRGMQLNDTVREEYSVANGVYLRRPSRDVIEALDAMMQDHDQLHEGTDHV